MNTRKVKDAIDLETNEKVYLKGHAKATYMSDGRTVEDAINYIDSGGEVQKTTEAEITAMGFTKNQGTITEIKMNGVSKGTSGHIDLGTVITSHQDISGKINGDGTITKIVKVSALPSNPDANTLYIIV